MCRCSCRSRSLCRYSFRRLLVLIGFTLVSWRLRDAASSFAGVGIRETGCFAPTAAGSASPPALALTRAIATTNPTAISTTVRRDGSGSLRLSTRGFISGALGGPWWPIRTVSSAQRSSFIVSLHPPSPSGPARRTKAAARSGPEAGAHRSRARFRAALPGPRSPASAPGRSSPRLRIPCRAPLKFEADRRIVPMVGRSETDFTPGGCAKETRKPVGCVRREGRASQGSLRSTTFRRDECRFGTISTSSRKRAQARRREKVFSSALPPFSPGTVLSRRIEICRRSMWRLATWLSK